MSRVDIELKPYAEGLGFVATADRLGVNTQGVPHNPWTFVKDGVTIWYVGQTRVSTTLPPEAQHGDWMAADLIDGSFCNHRSHNGLQNALDSEFTKERPIPAM